MKKKRNDKRHDQRLGAELLVRLDKAVGFTRDVSASGVFFETDATYDKGSRIHFEIDLDTPWGPVKCDCAGEIVRVERRDGTVGVAVHFTDSGPRPRPAPAGRGPRQAHAKRRAR